MSEFKELIDEASKLPNAKEKMPEWSVWLSKVMEEIKEVHPEIYEKYYNEFYVLNYGYHLNEETATKWVSEMKSSDGEHGEHYSKDLANMYAKQNGIDFKEAKFNCWDWYAILNMVYSDYHQALGSGNDTYIRIAKATLEDYDVKDKAYKYYHYVVEGEE